MSKNDLFEIRPDVICDVYKGTSNHKVRTCLASVLDRENLDKPTVELFDNFLSRHPEFNELRKELPDEADWIKSKFITGARCKKMVNIIRRHIDLDGLIKVHSDNSRSYGKVNEYYFYGETEKVDEYFQNPQRGAILNQDIEIDRVKHHVSYRFLFAFVFSKTSYAYDFLTYHFEEGFNRDLSAYKKFLAEVEKENQDLIIPGKKLWELWLEESPISKQLSPEAAAFKALFKTDELYNYVITELSKGESEAWFNTDGNFIRVGRGNDNEGAVCDLFALLIDYQYIESIPKNKIADHAKKCLGIVVGDRSSRITHKKKPYTQLQKRLSPAKSISKNLT